VAVPVAVPNVERHQCQGGEGNAGIRHHDGVRGRPADRVQFLDIVSPSAGWTSALPQIDQTVT
jgi:hypothetical protein